MERSKRENSLIHCVNWGLNHVQVPFDEVPFMLIFMVSISPLCCGWGVPWHWCNVTADSIALTVGHSRELALSSWRAFQLQQGSGNMTDPRWRLAQRLKFFSPDGLFSLSCQPSHCVHVLGKPATRWQWLFLTIGWWIILLLHLFEVSLFYLNKMMVSHFQNKKKLN